MCVLTVSGLLCGMNTAGLKLVVVYSSEKLVPIYQTTRCRNSEDNNVNLRFCKNTKSCRRRSRRNKKKGKDSCDATESNFGYLLHKFLSAVHRNKFSKELDFKKKRNAEVSCRICLYMYAYSFM